VKFCGWLKRLGARQVVLGADEHESHRGPDLASAQLASTALAGTVAEKLGPAPRLRLAGSAWRYDQAGAELLRFVAGHCVHQY